jgi:hypothetical protein
MRRTVFSLLLIVALVGSALFVPPALAASDECRVNSAGSMGGDTIVFVDRNGAPSQQWSDGGLGGMKVLNASGQELVFWPASLIEPATKSAQAAPGTLFEIGTGRGTHGTIRLSVYALEDGNHTLQFVFAGYDSAGKDVDWTFSGCVAPTVECPVAIKMAAGRPSLAGRAGLLSAGARVHAYRPADPCYYYYN